VFLFFSSLSDFASANFLDRLLLLSLPPSLLLQTTKEKNKQPLLACCQQKDPVTPTYSPFHQVRVIFVHANFVFIYLLDAPPPTPLSSEKRKEKKRPCLLARCQQGRKKESKKDPVLFVPLPFHRQNLTGL
jgi:hypothetical protein